ncbi:unnamed protein product [Symbiodinium necroappetens]|uniref:Uncharacterized protein n=1 Tax=Symbiodinium necroappetens TaxID=1628268 RepID=A0A812T748_9DINO|nr:unnamed protein product [Symbiodinium necroappetens]
MVARKYLSKKKCMRRPAMTRMQLQQRTDSIDLVSLHVVDLSCLTSFDVSCMERKHVDGRPHHAEARLGEVSVVSCLVASVAGSSNGGPSKGLPKRRFCPLGAGESCKACA